MENKYQEVSFNKQIFTTIFWNNNLHWILDFW
jgi:hypothetical protein